MSRLRERFFKEKPGASARRNGVLFILLLVLAAAAVVLWPRSTARKNGENAPAPVARQTALEGKTTPAEPGALTPGQVIDYDRMVDSEGGKDLVKAMDQRKEKYGLKDSVDLVVRPDETIKVGGETVSVQGILNEVLKKEGGIAVQDLDKTKAAQETSQEFGIYVVQPGDNLWNVHFRFLREHFDSLGIALEDTSDEPDLAGKSSGVGKILKFSEHLVYIYNLRKREFDTDINLLHPRGKIVVYNMTRVHGMLGQINYAEVDRIQFDGDNLWLPPRE
jgi:hypothetical protein